MNDFQSKVRSILADTDAKLLRLIAEAASAGDLAAIDFARTAAGSVRRTRESLESDSGPANPKPSPVPPRPAQRGERRGKRERAKYPRFINRNGTLYRIGWSKKHRAEYEQKVSKQIFEQVVGALSASARTGNGPFTVEQIAARVNREADLPVPAYQVYLVIGWLRERGCIEQQGRDGYRIPTSVELGATSAWQSLDSEK